MTITLDTIDLSPGALQMYQEELSKSQTKPDKGVQPSGVWCTEIGRLNQVWLLWSTTEDEVVPNLPQSARIENASRRVLTPAPFSPKFTLEQTLQILEIRIYRYRHDSIQEVIEKWSKKIEGRIERSPMIFCGYTNSSFVADWIHLWSYDDLNQRAEVRKSVIESGLWPPGAFKGLIDQQSIILKTLG